MRVQAARAKTTARGTVLFIEDDGTIADMYRLQLELDGYTVWVAADGESGLRIARSRAPDVILLDVRLPQRDGFEVLGALRENPRTRQLPVIFLSNYGTAEMVRRGLELGAREYLVKSQVTPVELSRRLSTWIQ